MRGGEGSPACSAGRYSLRLSTWLQLPAARGCASQGVCELFWGDARALHLAQPACQFEGAQVAACEHGVGMGRGAEAGRELGPGPGPACMRDMGLSMHPTQLLHMGSPAPPVFHSLW